jgi:hypothetical protein
VCDATLLTLGSFALKVGGDVANHIAQNKSARANEVEARAAETRQINDINVREMQEKQAASQQIEAAARSTRTALSSAQLSAGEAGVTGASVDALLNTIGAEGSTATQNIKLNQENTNQQLERQKLGVSAEADSRVNSVPKSNPFALALRIAGAGVGLATQFQSRATPSAGDVSPAAPNLINGRSAASYVSATPSGIIPPTFRLRQR